ncbi:MAG: hypothetical protein IRZ07_14440 [Microbispora sp.]|nr:hypothetical protein [Microbispora sp.]
MAKSRRVRDLLAAGIAIGILIWGVVGAWVAATVNNFPSNVWVPIAYGASKGVFLGLLAGIGAAAGLTSWARRAPKSIAFVGALIGGSILGTIKDFNGPPEPLVYFMPPMPDERWYWSTMLIHWSGKVMAPAAVCAVGLVMLVGRLNREPYPARLSLTTNVMLTLAGLALLLFPEIASSFVPEVQGNGQHVNEGIIAAFYCWAIAIPVITAGTWRTRRLLRRSARGAQPDSGWA